MRAKLHDGVLVEAMKCINCQTEFPPSKMGKKYCGEKCRRAAEFTIRRIDRRLENLEKDRGECEKEINAPLQLNDAYGRNPAERLLAIQAQIQTEKARFLELL